MDATALFGGLGKPQDLRELLKAAGWTDADQRHAQQGGLING
jgi:hypothetical protein